MTSKCFCWSRSHVVTLWLVPDTSIGSSVVSRETVFTGSTFPAVFAGILGLTTALVAAALVEAALVAAAVTLAVVAPADWATAALAPTALALAALVPAALVPAALVGNFL